MANTLHGQLRQSFRPRKCVQLKLPHEGCCLGVVLLSVTTSGNTLEDAENAYPLLRCFVAHARRGYDYVSDVAEYGTRRRRRVL